MKHTCLLLPLMLLSCLTAYAENWDEVVTSKDYYYGIGRGSTQAEASEQALAALIESIAVNVSSQFEGLVSNRESGGEVASTVQVQSCIRTYASSSLTNVSYLIRGQAPNIEVLRFIRRTELERIYDDRKAKAIDMVRYAKEAEEALRLDMALEYYYWAYSLVRSIQRPSEVRDAEGHVLLTWIPFQVKMLLSHIDVSLAEIDGNRINLLFTYKGKHISQLDFTYSDGRTSVAGNVRSGYSTMEMEEGYSTDVYHLTVEYEYKGQATGDADMESVLAVVPRQVFKEADKQVRHDNSLAVERTGSQKEAGGGVTVTDFSAAASASQSPDAAPADTATIALPAAVTRVIDAINTRRYSDANSCFTFEGLSAWRDLVAYGTARIVGQPQLVLHKSTKGYTIVRGLKMSFSFRTGGKKTFVEDVVLTVQPDGRISGLAFGMGEVAEHDILYKDAPGWDEETRELIMQFMENYKTAYCLKRLDYIRDIFADDATIIVGNVVRRRALTDSDTRQISAEGMQQIVTNRYTKDEYLRNLERCFHRNEFINLRFSNNEVQLLDKFDTKEMFAIQIGQEYTSSTYSDRGYLFLLVDMTDHNAPQIKIRSWQPREVDMNKLYNAGDFYDE